MHPAPAELWRCNLPPLDILEQMDFGGANLPVAPPTTLQFGRCRWVCAPELGCDRGSQVDVIGPIGNVSRTHATCLYPPELNGREGAIEVQLAIEGQWFIRPDNQGRNRVRPKIHFYTYRQRMYARTPSGGPLYGGTLVTISGEGITGYGRTLDSINQMMGSENLLGLPSVWYYQLDGFTWPTYGKNENAGAALSWMQSNVRCSFGPLGDAPAYAIGYTAQCFQPGNLGDASCVENTTITCQVPASLDAREVQLAVAVNGNDAIGGAHYVPVATYEPDPQDGLYTYYVAPTASRLVPPGGPVLGMTSVTILGRGFAGLPHDLGLLACRFSGGVGGVRTYVAPSGDKVVCNTTPPPPRSATSSSASTGRTSAPSRSSASTHGPSLRASRRRAAPRCPRTRSRSSAPASTAWRASRCRTRRSASWAA